jgi:hypothetical protein
MTTIAAPDTPTTEPPPLTTDQLADVLADLRAPQKGHPGQAHAFLDADDDTAYPVPADAHRAPAEGELDAVERLIAEVIRDVARPHGFPKIPRWQVGRTENGLPLVSGQLAPMGVYALREVLTLIAQVPGRRLDVADPAVIAVEFTWPEPLNDVASRPTPRAVVRIWAPDQQGGAW